MELYDQTRRVAVIGGARIPFCRSNTLLCRPLQPRHDDRRAQRRSSTSYNLKGAHIDEAVGGAVVTHSKDFNLAREAVLGTQLAPRRPASP